MTDTVKVATRAPEALQELELGDSFSFGELVSAVECRRGRPLRIVELADLSDRDGICALWLGRDAEDLVVHAQSASALHRQQFVLHELAHIILDHGHDNDNDDDADGADQLLPDIAPSTRRRLLRRQDLVTAEEIAAESLADHLAAAIRGSVMHESKFLEIFG